MVSRVSAQNGTRALDKDKARENIPKCSALDARAQIIALRNVSSPIPTRHRNRVMTKKKQTMNQVEVIHEDERWDLENGEGQV